MNNGKIIESELVRLVARIVDVINDEHKLVETELLLWKMKPQSLEQLANITELRIKRNEIKTLKKKILSVVKTSTNNLIISTIKVEDN